MRWDNGAYTVRDEPEESCRRACLAPAEDVAVLAPAVLAVEGLGAAARVAHVVRVHEVLALAARHLDALA